MAKNWVWDLGLRLWIFLPILGLGFWVQGFTVQGSGAGVRDWGQEVGVVDGVRPI